ncbi:hypothetical protein R1flu_006527 [Riccia fluitans]|uniref:Uncharacterized protein n=1 Tax=Riccia fluitans TaxID=41844 RepID=A0ABD1YX00_9MARC
MIADSGNHRDDPIFEEGEYHPFAIVVESVGAARPGEGKKKKRKKNSDQHRVGLVCLIAHINAAIRYAWMIWFILNVDKKRNYREYYTLGTNKRVL